MRMPFFGARVTPLAMTEMRPASRVRKLATWLVFTRHHGILATQSKRLAFYAGIVTTGSGGIRWMLEAVLVRLSSNLGTYDIPLLFLGGLQLLRRRGQSDLWVLSWISIVFLSLILTLPVPRYFLPTFPALAIAMAQGLRRPLDPTVTERVVLLALLFCGGALFLFVDWS